MQQMIPTTTNTPGVAGPPQGQWTAADWEALPDDGNRYEIIDGVLYMSTAPSFFHQWIILRLIDSLGLPAERAGLAHVIFAPIGVFMPGAKPVQPDFLLILKQNAAIIRDRRVYGVPDFIAEVLSPGSHAYDEDIKLAAYARAGVPEYAVIDPELRQVRLYQRDDAGSYPPPITSAVGDTFTLRCLPTLPVSVLALFDGAPDQTL